jgi:hypothetical protein
MSWAPVKTLPKENIQSEGEKFWGKSLRPALSAAPDW